MLVGGFTSSYATRIGAVPYCPGATTERAAGRVVQGPWHSLVQVRIVVHEEVRHLVPEELTTLSAG